MKKYIILIIAITFAACKKDGNPPASPKKSNANFPKNTEWVGVNDGKGTQYPQPCCLKFNEDNTVTMYSLFYFQLGGASYTQLDSINGKINSMDSVANGSIRIAVSYTAIKEDQVMTITNRNTLVSIPANNNNITVNSHTYTFNLFPASGFPLNNGTNGGIWRGPALGPGGAPQGYAYPDLNIIFSTTGDRITEYIRNKQYVMQEKNDSLVVLQVPYQQIGARVYMRGFNEISSKLIDYFGVLQLSGDKMWVDSRATIEARLPYYTQTIEWYGPRGMTPVISKQ